MHPASTAHTTRCGAWRTSLRTWDVPRTNAGTLQRARKTPKTIMRETVMGEMSGLMSLMGASAPPSHAPAAKPQKMPSACRERMRGAGTGAGNAAAASVSEVLPVMSAKLIQKQETAGEYGQRNPEVEVGGDHAK